MMACTSSCFAWKNKSDLSTYSIFDMLGATKTDKRIEGILDSIVLKTRPAGSTGSIGNQPPIRSSYD